MNEMRRYRDEEVRAIFESATTVREASRAHRAAPHGLTLNELQEIGKEVGIRPDRIAMAAARLDSGVGTRVSRGFLGMPTTVVHTVDLPRPPMDQEWERLVSELRTTFNAPGKVESDGNLRQWTNGNLYAVLEPDGAGARLRMGSFKSSAVTINWLGGTWIIGAVAALAILGSVGDLNGGTGIMPGLLGLLGTGSFAYNAITVPQWARKRKEQMTQIAGRALAFASKNPPAGASDG